MKDKKDDRKLERSWRNSRNEADRLLYENLCHLNNAQPR